MRPSILIGLLACAGASACSKGRERAQPADSPATAKRVGAAPVDTTTPKSLSGTRWRLVEVQSMSDAQGATRPDDPAKYTVAFDAESDRIYMQLDCNQVRGSYTGKPSADPKSGSLTIGPLAGYGTTCTPSALGTRISRDMPYVRSYLFANGRLSMSLMADGGIYIWSREPNRY